jgi:hypothetical protein
VSQFGLLHPRRAFLLLLAFILFAVSGRMGIEDRGESLQISKSPFLRFSQSVLFPLAVKLGGDVRIEGLLLALLVGL